MYVILLIRKSFSHECIQKSEDELASFIGTKLHLSLESAIIYKLDKKLNKTLWKKAYSDPKWCLRNYMSSLKIKNKNIISFVSVKNTINKNKVCYLNLTF